MEGDLEEAVERVLDGEGKDVLVGVEQSCDDERDDGGSEGGGIKTNAFADAADLPKIMRKWKEDS